MTNLSDKSRKDLVLGYLLEYRDQWVDGPELANERVGGSEGLKRLRELRAEGHHIETRRHPDPTRDIWQYRITNPPPVVSPLRPTTQPTVVTNQYKEKPPRVVFGQTRLCPRCGGVRASNCDRCNGVGLVPA